MANGARKNVRQIVDDLGEKRHAARELDRQIKNLDSQTEKLEAFLHNQTEESEAPNEQIILRIVPLLCAIPQKKTKLKQDYMVNCYQQIVNFMETKEKKLREGGNYSGSTQIILEVEKIKKFISNIKRNKAVGDISIIYQYMKELNEESNIDFENMINNLQTN